MQQFGLMMNYSLQLQDKRLQNLEETVSALSKRIDEISSELRNLSQAGFDNGSSLDCDIAPSRKDIPSAGFSFERILSSDVLMYTSVVCFTLVFALVLRIITDNQIIPTQIGVYLGLIYCCSLILWSLLPTAHRYKTSLTVGVCGLVVMCLLLFESFRFLEQIPIALYFTLMLSAALASIAIGQKHRSSIVGWAGLSVISVLFVVSMIDTATFGWTTAFLAVGTGIVFLGYQTYGLWPARPIVGVLVLFVLFYWNRQLNYAYYLASEPYLANHFFTTAILGFAFIFCLPSLAAGASRRRLTIFEKLAPNLAVLCGFLFINNEMLRQHVLDAVHAKYGLFLSFLLLGTGLVYGLRNWPNGYGLRTFLSAGTILLLFTSSKLLHSAESAIALWSIFAMLLFCLSIYFQCPDLRLISYAFHVIVFLIAIAKGAIVFHEESPYLSIGITVLLSFNFVLHYFTSQRIVNREQTQGENGEHPKMGLAILLMIGAGISLYFAGTNLFLLCFGPSQFTSSLQSIWLTVIASLILLTGSWRKIKSLEVIGFLFFAAAAVKVFLVDLILNTGIYFACSVFSFGVIALISSYLIRTYWRREI